MTTEKNHPQNISTESGLIAFFDILGFRKMLLANTVRESLGIINDKILNELIVTEKTYGKPIGLKTFVISDSILIALPMDQGRNLPNAAEAYLFPVFCSQLMFGLLLMGLPVREAIAFGEFHIQNDLNKIIFTGQPIVDAYELASSIDLAACAIVPSSECKVLNTDTHSQFQIHTTPIKNLPPCNLYLLKYGHKDFSREMIIGKFEAHKKHLDPHSFAKLNNTIEFFAKCGELKKA